MQAPTSAETYRFVLQKSNKVSRTSMPRLFLPPRHVWTEYRAYAYAYISDFINETRMKNKRTEWVRPGVLYGRSVQA